MTGALSHPNGYRAAHVTSNGLTLIICTYNNAASLKQTLTRIEEQGPDALRDCTVLVIDNNCTDSTPDVVAKAQARGQIPRLRQIREPRQGQAFARLRGVAEAATEWIAFIDDDNLLQEGWVANAKQFIATHPDCGVFGGRISICWEIPPPDLLRRNDYAFAGLDLGPVDLELRGEDRWQLRGAGLVCRASVLTASGWREWQGCTGRQRGMTSSGDDLEIVMRIAREGYAVWYSPRCRIQHLINTSRISIPYMEKLHFGFGLAHPLLLGFKRRQSHSRWAIQLLGSIMRALLQLVARGLRSITQPAHLAEARLTCAYLCGTFYGIPHALRLAPQERRIWLGQRSGTLDEVEAL